MNSTLHFFTSWNSRRLVNYLNAINLVLELLETVSDTLLASTLALVTKISVLDALCWTTDLLLSLVDDQITGQ